jgi:hypothetical protein
LLQYLSRAGEWFLVSGIQESNGGVARYYSVDTGRNHAVSTEITGYAVSAFVFLHSLTGEQQYLDRAVMAARFLTGIARNGGGGAMPFEIDPPCLTYFFDCGMVVRGLLAAWRASGEEEFLDVAASLGRDMARDFAAPDGGFHPILSLPEKRPAGRDAARWSRSPGCYQLKAAMAWWDLSEATGEAHFCEAYHRTLDDSLKTWAEFLPGHPDRLKVVDRLHAFLYFLEGLLPRAGEPRAAAALSEGIGRVACYVREMAPAFERCDVYAQLLRIRLHADWCGAAPLDGEAAALEAAAIATFQETAGNSRIGGGFRFGRLFGAALPHVSPVATAFALQALALWNQGRRAQAHLHLLI